MEKIQLKVKDLSAAYGSKKFLQGINFQIQAEENWAILGEMGAGKTSLAKALCGRIFRTGQVIWNLGKENPLILLIEQQSIIRNRSNTTEFYYQQRFNSQDQEDAYTIGELLAGYDEDLAAFWLGVFHLDKLKNRPTIQLSNGENKRLQLIQAILKWPDFIILDNPYLGLDVDGRKLLSEALILLKKQGVPFLLIHSNDELPAFITHVLVLEQGRVMYQGAKNSYQKVIKEIPFQQKILDNLIQTSEKFSPFEWAVRMEDATIRYKDKIILNEVNFGIKQGEAWNLRGPNGSGKSTLISMITADNPQSYSQKLWLFDRRRGTGESIWEIKKKIGFVGPELHLYFRTQITCLSVVGTGLIDSLGLYKDLTEAQKARAFQWMEVMGLAYLRDQKFNEISLGEQKLCLICRALVKNPPLLILDEPGQGLAEREIRHLKKVVNYLVEHSSTTILYVSHYQEDIPERVDKIYSL